MRDPVRMAVVGCGLISERSHVPAILRSRRADLRALVDRDTSRAATLRRDFGLECEIVSRVEDLGGLVDAAVVATPNSSHAAVTGTLLGLGVHVLCEKPLALTARDADDVCTQADRAGRVLAVGHVNRFHENTEMLRAVIDEGVLGQVQSYDFELGVRFAWPAVSTFYFDRARSGGGVLVSEAIHWLDRLLYWFGDVTDVACVDNDRGGIETDIELDAGHRLNGALVRGSSRVSWLYELRNTLIVSGTAGRAVVWKDKRASIGLYRSLRGRETCMELRDGPEVGCPVSAYFDMQLEDFLDAVLTGRPPKVDGREGARVVKLIETAYRAATHAEPGWAAVRS